MIQRVKYHIIPIKITAPVKNIPILSQFPIIEKRSPITEKAINNPMTNLNSIAFFPIIFLCRDVIGEASIKAFPFNLGGNKMQNHPVTGNTSHKEAEELLFKITS